MTWCSNYGRELSEKEIRLHGCKGRHCKHLGADFSRKKAAGLAAKEQNEARMIEEDYWGEIT